MTDLTRTRWRWAAPIGAIALVAAGTLAVNSIAQADPGLPSRTAEQLVTDALQAKVPGMSGTVSETADLGLPSLAGLGKDNSLQSWVTGTHTARVWQSGEDKQRVSIPNGSNESDFVRNGNKTWYWDSTNQSVTTSNLRVRNDRRPQTSVTPQQVAQKLLTEVSKTSTVSTATNSTVAGRPAYELVITPSQRGTKVAKVEMAIDGVTHLPLQLEVFAVGAAKPSIQIGFTTVDFSVPSDSVFAAPTGKSTKTVSPHERKAPGKGIQTHKPAKNAAKVIGDGWQSVLVTKLPASGTSGHTAPGQEPGQSKGSDQRQLQQLLNGLPKVSGDWGSGRLFNGTLFSAVLSDDGRVAVGAVTPDLLYSALKSR